VGYFSLKNCSFTLINSEGRQEEINKKNEADKKEEEEDQKKDKKRNEK
jgi:hypothetical protein